MYTVYAQKYENKQKEWHHATKPLKKSFLGLLHHHIEYL
jgi:hypothetical protein